MFSLAGVGFALVTGYSWFFSPLMDYNKQIAALTSEVETKDADPGL